MLGLLAALVVTGTVALVLAAGGDLGVVQAFRGGPVTLTAIIGLFGIVLVVVGAVAAVDWLIGRIVRRRAPDNQ